MNNILPFLPFIGAFLGIRCILGMFQTGRDKQWEQFAQWSIGLFAVGCVMAVLSVLLEG